MTIFSPTPKQPVRGFVVVTAHMIAAPLLSLLGTLLGDLTLSVLTGGAPHSRTPKVCLCLDPLNAVVGTLALTYLGARLFPGIGRSARWAWIPMCAFWLVSFLLSVQQSGLGATVVSYFNPPISEVLPGEFYTDIAVGSITYAVVLSIMSRRIAPGNAT